MTSYPAEPWRLHGHAYAGIFWVRRRPVVAAFFVYEDPSPLTYHEVMATRLVWRRLRPYVDITHIWVDSVASRDGGRELWAIPKELADFEVEPHVAYVAEGIGSLWVERSRVLPFRLPLGFATFQQLGGVTRRTPVRGSARIGPARARWELEARGGLRHLAGRRPLLSLAVRDFRLVFGRARGR